MKYGKVVECDGKLMTALEAARKSGLAPSTVMKLAGAGKPIVRQPRKGKEPRRVLHDGKLLTAEEIAPLIGMNATTVRIRMRNGKPLERIARRGMVGVVVEHEGRQTTLGQLARDTGQSSGKIYYRYANGLPLTGEVKRKKPAPSITESGVFRVNRAEGENGLYWSDDLECRIWHLYCGGDGYGECTLAEIAALWDLSRERIRQVEHVAINKIRRDAKLGKQDAVNALMWFEMRAEQRNSEQPDHWDQAEMNSPGHFDVAPGRKARTA